MAFCGEGVPTFYFQDWESLYNERPFFAVDLLILKFFFCEEKNQFDALFSEMCKMKIWRLQLIKEVWGVKMWLEMVTDIS